MLSRERRIDQINETKKGFIHMLQLCHCSEHLVPTARHRNSFANGNSSPFEVQQVYFSGLIINQNSYTEHQMIWAFQHISSIKYSSLSHR